MKPRNPDFAAVVRASFERQGMMGLLGAELVEVTPGGCVIAAPVRAETSQQHGFAHAGLAWTIGDSAAGYAALSLRAAGEEVLTVEMKVNLIAPARGERLLARGWVIRAGRQLVTVGAEVHAEAAGRLVHVATMLGTMIAVTG